MTPPSLFGPHTFGPAVLCSAGPQYRGEAHSPINAAATFSDNIFLYQTSTAEERWPDE